MSKRSNSDVGMKKDTYLTSTSVALNRRRFSLGLPLLAAGAAAPQEVVAAKAPSRDEAPIVKLNTFRAKLCRKHAHARDIATRPIEANRRLLRACRQRPRCYRAAERDQQLPPSDGDCHTPLPCEARKGNDTTTRACYQ